MVITTNHIEKKQARLNTQIRKTKDMNDLVYFHFKIDGEIDIISKQEAFLRMREEQQGWQEENCETGKIYTENLDLVFLGTDYGLDARSMKYQTSANLVRNTTASRILGFDVFGECFFESQLTRPDRSIYPQT